MTNNKFCSFYDILEYNAKYFGNKTAIFIDNKKISYLKLKYAADKVAAYLKYEEGVKKGDKIAIFANNSWEYVATIFAISKLGAIVVPINNMLKSKELSYLLNDAKADILFASDELRVIVEGSSASINSKKIIWFGKELKCTRFNAILDYSKKVSKEKVSLDDEAVIFYTSGTTGKPKGALLTNKNILSNLQAIKEGLNLNEKEKVLLFLPIFQSYIFSVNLLTPLYLGASVVITPKWFSFKDILTEVLKKRVTVFIAIPEIYKALSNANLPWYFYKFNKIKYFVSGSSPIDKDTILKLKNKFKKAIFIEGYGLSEASPVVSFNLNVENKIGSVGKPVKNCKLKIIDSYGIEVASNQIGEILVSGDNVMKGYFNNEEKSCEVLKNGWLKTGDMGYVDNEGYLYIVDRKKDIIIYKGINIYPKEIEEIINGFYGVKNSAVIGYKDDKEGEIPVAFIELKDDAQINIDKLKEHLKGFLADFKVPKKFIIIDEIPKTTTKKIKKDTLRKNIKNYL
jgi:long-chain acyl-CoA synthetase